MPLGSLKLTPPVDLGRGTPGTTFQIAILTVKLSFLFVGMASILLLVKLAIPFSHELFLSTVPGLWISVCRYLVPPYLFITVNFIIIIIWRLSDKRHHHRDPSDAATAEAFPKHKDLDTHSPRRATSPETWSDTITIPNEIPPEYNVSTHETSSEVYCVSTESNEKSAAAAAASSSQSAVKDSIELSVASSTPVEEEPDSMNATWMAITGGIAAPSKRQLKKSDTWEVSPQVEAEPDPPPLPRPGRLTRRELKKSETFKEVSSASAAWNASRRVETTRRGDLLLANDELNRRIEAFIKKGYDDLRLQRQESYQRYAEAVNRGY